MHSKKKLQQSSQSEYLILGGRREGRQIRVLLTRDPNLQCCRGVTVLAPDGGVWWHVVASPSSLLTVDAAGVAWQGHGVEPLVWPEATSTTRKGEGDRISQVSLVVGMEAARTRVALTRGDAREAADKGAVLRTLPELVRVKWPHASPDLVLELAVRLPAAGRRRPRSRRHRMEKNVSFLC